MKRTSLKIFYVLNSEKIYSSVFLNLGVINLPKSILENIESIDSVMNIVVMNCNLCSVITVNNVTTFSITKLTKNSEFEDKIYELLYNDGIISVVEGVNYMKINNVYPKIEKKKLPLRIKLLNILKVIFLLIVIISLIINIIIGGFPWSLIILFAINFCYAYWFYY